MKRKKRILNLEWATNSRDTHIIDPVLVSLHDRYGYEVIQSNLMYGLFKLLRYRPDVFIMSNDSGAIDNVLIFRLAYKLGITTIALHSEGLNICNMDEKEQTLIDYYGDDCFREKNLI